MFIFLLLIVLTLRDGGDHSRHQDGLHGVDWLDDLQVCDESQDALLVSLVMEPPPLSGLKVGRTDHSTNLLLLLSRLLLHPHCLPPPPFGLRSRSCHLLGRWRCPGLVLTVSQQEPSDLSLLPDDGGPGVAQYGASYGRQTAQLGSSQESYWTSQTKTEDGTSYGQSSPSPGYLGAPDISRLCGELTIIVILTSQ